MKPTIDKRLADEISKFYGDPLGYVMFNYPWDTNEAIQLAKLPPKYRERFPNCEYGPDLWQCEYLDRLGQEIRARKFDGKTPVAPIFITTVTGHGVGKSTLAGWITNFIMDTRPMSKGTVTAITGDQLRTKTWAEVGKWRRLGLTRNWFIYSDTRGNMTLKHPSLGMEWSVQAQTCKEENAQAFAGQHAATSTSWYLFDEASGIPHKIWEVRRGGLVRGEPMAFDFGNPTENTGDFYENCEGRFKAGYLHFHVDSREVQNANQKYIQGEIDLMGIDSDFIKVRYLGKFPSQGNTQFIAGADVRTAEMRLAPPFDLSAKRVIGVDCGGEGASGDPTCIFARRGNDAKSFPPLEFKGLDQLQIAAKVIEQFNFFTSIQDQPAMIFVDATGGYGGGVIATLRNQGYPVTEVQFGRTASDPSHYKYVVDEIWGKMKDWVKNRGALWSDAEDSLYNELTQRTYGFIRDTEIIRLEPKTDMKARGVPSPNKADALATTFYFDVANLVTLPINGSAKMNANRDYDPIAKVSAD